MLEKLLTQNEGKTLEFKENTKSLTPIVKTVIAFANTAGGNIVIGVRDDTKEVVGISNALDEEERLASVIADTVEPLILPDIRIQTFREKELLVIHVPHMAGPFYLKSAGLERGVYVRLGSTNRLADSETIFSLRMLAKNISYDELPCLGASIKDVDVTLIQETFRSTFGRLNQSKYASLGILTKHRGKQHLSNGGVLLFASNRYKWFPDSQIFCVCFADETRSEIIDQRDVVVPLMLALEEVLDFIKRNTRTGAMIGELKREDLPQYPTRAIREAVINAIVHADYTKQGVTTQVSIFSNRIEITNPGALPYGQTMELALLGVSNMRNKMIGRTFRELKYIERLGTGLGRIIEAYHDSPTRQPVFEELNAHFRATLYAPAVKKQKLEDWEKLLIDALASSASLSTADIANLWNVTKRTARNRLKKMVDRDLVVRLGTSSKDPRAVFKLME